jgi:RNA polymerase sigma-70 factor (ECF subfamily)
LNQPVDANEIGRLFDDHAAALEWYASQWTRWPEDCVQDAFVRLAAQAPRPDNTIAWLYRVVRNGALNASRSERRRGSHEEHAARLKRIQQGQTQREHNGTPEQLLEALSGLPQQQRELILLRIWSELTWQQIAELTGTSTSSAHRNYLAALANLKTRLEPPCPNHLKSRPTSR